MLVAKGVTYCDVCKKRLIVLGGTWMHVADDGTVRYTVDHAPVRVGGGR